MQKQKHANSRDNCYISGGCHRPPCYFGVSPSICTGWLNKNLPWHCCLLWCSVANDRHQDCPSYMLCSLVPLELWSLSINTEIWNWIKSYLILIYFLTPFLSVFHSPHKKRYLGYLVWCIVQVNVIKMNQRCTKKMKGLIEASHDYGPTNQ